jgi:hypothetical protein
VPPDPVHLCSPDVAHMAAHTGPERRVDSMLTPEHLDEDLF